MLIFKLIINLGLLFTFSHMEFLEDQFHQNDYKIEFRIAHVDWFNESYFQQFKFVSFKYNRTHFASNMTFEMKIEIKDDLHFLTQVYKFMSNEFRVFPIRYRITFCTYLKLDVAGFGTAFASNNPKCPLRKGVVYKIHNFIPDGAHFPPFMPNGEYKLEMNLLYDEKRISTSYIVGSVFRPIVPKK